MVRRVLSEGQPPKAVATAFGVDCFDLPLSPHPAALALALRSPRACADVEDPVAEPLNLLEPQRSRAPKSDMGLFSSPVRSGSTIGSISAKRGQRRVAGTSLVSVGCPTAHMVGGRH